jgi:hypothetical protein
LACKNKISKSLISTNSLFISIGNILLLLFRVTLLPPNSTWQQIYLEGDLLGGRQVCYFRQDLIVEALITTSTNNHNNHNNTFSQQISPNSPFSSAEIM